MIRGGQGRAALAATWLATWAGACDPTGAAPSASAPAQAGGSVPVPAAASASVPTTSASLREALKRWRAEAAAAVGRMRAHPAGAPEGHLALRRAARALEPFVRTTAAIASEVLYGPERAMEEGGGALGRLDRALAAGDGALVNKELEQIERALGALDQELARAPQPIALIAQATSDACFELGLVVLEASALVPDAPAAVVADLQGILDGIDAGARALARGADAAALVLARTREIRAALATVSPERPLGGRAELVLASGALGADVRKLAADAGAPARLPYEARYPVAGNRAEEPVSALTLPAPRRDPRPGDAAAMAALGERLFFERKLSRGAVRSCADCHVPARAFTDGLRAPRSLDQSAPLVRNTPTLLYGPLHAAQLWDARFASAERQALKVIHTRAEMGLSSEELEAVLRASPEHARAFEQVFGAGGLTAANVARALVAFEVAALVPGTAPVDRLARGERNALDERARAGLDVFAGAGRCARCHVPPLFGGSRPTDFAVAIVAALGVPTAPGRKELDRDAGRFDVTARPLDRGAFKTPTARNAALTAPYFHHGRFATLEQVVDFYDTGGGVGAGLEVPNQDPDVRPLKLTAQQKRDLVHFMREGLRDARLPLASRR
jgi:cytochrome c peroxidase